MTTVAVEVGLPTGRVQLHRDPMDGPHLRSLPAWIRPSGTYWHIPRAAAKYPAVGSLPERIVVRTWCGQSRRVLSRRQMSRSAPPDLACGTCVGRHAGYNRVDGLVFSPDDHWALPTWCPGREGPVRRQCFACGGRVRYHYDYCGAIEGRHHPEPALAERYEPCPYHGWRKVATIDGVLMCTDWGCRNA